jgi:hypothetical protein
MVAFRYNGKREVRMARYILRFGSPGKASEALKAIDSSSAKVIDQSSRMLLVEAPETEMTAIGAAHPEFVIAPENSSYAIPTPPIPQVSRR